MAAQPRRPPSRSRGKDAHSEHRLAATTLLLACALALPAVSAATPTVTFKAKPLPIPGYPHTGFILGAGTALLKPNTTSRAPNTAASRRR